MCNGNLLGKSNQAEIRSAHKRIRGYEFHTSLEQFTDDTLNLDQVWNNDPVDMWTVF